MIGIRGSGGGVTARFLAVEFEGCGVAVEHDSRACCVCACKRSHADAGGFIGYRSGRADVQIVVDLFAQGLFDVGQDHDQIVASGVCCGADRIGGGADIIRTGENPARAIVGIRENFIIETRAARAENFAITDEAFGIGIGAVMLETDIAFRNAGEFHLFDGGLYGFGVAQDFTDFDTALFAVACLIDVGAGARENEGQHAEQCNCDQQEPKNIPRL